MATQSSRHFGGNKKVAPVGRGGSSAPGGGSIGRAAAIPTGRSAVKKGGGKAPAKAMKGTNMTSSKGKLPG